jgi:CelD/BcsL family acetyltransferase involved in cellulose biosynthesis
VLVSYDEGDVSRYGPGAAHLRELMSHAIAQGLQRFDFTVGDEPYKLEWSDTAITLYDHAAAATLLGWAFARYALVRRRIKRLIKQDQRLMRIFQRTRSVFGALARPFRQTGRHRPQV